MKKKKILYFVFPLIGFVVITLIKFRVWFLSSGSKLIDHVMPKHTGKTNFASGQ